MGLRLWLRILGLDLGFRVLDSGFGVWELGLRV